MSFVFFGILKVFTIKGPFDKVFSVNFSPVTVGLVAIAAKKRFKAPMYFWVQDLWPESISAASALSNKHILGFVGKITKFIYKHSDKILVQSKGFIPSILNFNVPKEKLAYYPNSTESFYQVLEPEEEFLSQLPAGPKVIFAGNIGIAQSFETLLSAAKKLKDKGVKVSWVILGDGRKKSDVEEQVVKMGLSDTFFLLGSKPGILMPKYFACADALIVSLKKEPIFALTIPSKVQSYMACGKPLLLALDGEGGRIVREANAGFTVGSEDDEEMALMIEKFLSLSDDKKKEMGNAARQYFEEKFEREFLLSKLEEILKLT